MALALGRTVASLERELSSAELTDWMAYSLLEPFGQGRADDGVRLLASAQFRDARGNALKPGDFLPVWRPQTEIDEATKLAGLLAWLDSHAVEGE